MAFSGLPTYRQILTNFATLLSGMSLARVMTAIALILVARQVGPGSYGQYVACFSLAKLTSVAFSWGLDGWLLWRGSAAARRTIALQSGVALAWKLILGVVWFLALYLLALTGWLNPATFPLSVLLITGLIVWADDLTNTVWSIFKSTLQNDVTFKIITSVQFVMLSVTVALLFANERNLVTFLWARLVVTAIGCSVAIYLLRRNVGVDFAGSAMLPIFRAATPFAASLVFSLIYERADVTIIGQFLGTQQAGLYGPAATIVTTLCLIPASAYAVMVPVFTRACAGPKARFAATLRLFLAVNAVLGICLAAGLVASAGWIMPRLYGTQYAEAGDVLAILSLVLGLRCVTFALGAAVVGAGLQARRLRAQALSAILNVVVNLIIVGAWGIRGVAWVYVFTELVLLIGYWLVLAPVRRRIAPGADQ
jgi:O-antigen/teichoic acid export membrane protein